MTPKNCPHCNTEWEEKETITEFFIRQGYSYRKASQSGSLYGCTPESPKHFGKNVIGIETPEYDGVSLWECQVCKSQFSRWTMEKV